MRRIISVLLENEAGSLSRVSGLFSSRGFNIESLTVSKTNDNSLSRMTIVTYCNEKQIEQIVKQLNKLIDVFKVVDLTEQKHIERELMLVKICIKSKNEIEVKHLVDIFSCKIVDVTDKTYTIEVSGKSKKLNAFLEAVSFATIIEVARSGVNAIARGRKII